MACSHDEDTNSRFEGSINVVNMAAGARQAGLSVLQTADLLGFSLTTISRVSREKKKIPCEQ